MKRSRTITTIFSTALLGLALLVPGAQARVELYASDALGNPADFVLGAVNTVSLRGTPDPPSGGETIEVRQVEGAQNCPLVTDRTTPVASQFQAYIHAGASVHMPNVFSGVHSGYRQSKFCVYSYWDVDPGVGPDTPSETYSQLVTFRDPADSVSWFDVASAESPERPFAVMLGSAEQNGAPSISVVRQGERCPASFVATAGSAVFPAPGRIGFSVWGELMVTTGFWHACAYLQSASGAPLLAETDFSRSPRGGWRPSYKLKRTLKARGSSWAIGSVTCPGPCSISAVAKRGSRTLAKATGRVTKMASSKRTKALKLKLKATAAGRKAARSGITARVTLTSTVDDSEVERVVKLRLR